MSRWGYCDFSELRKFAEKMEKLEEGVDDLSVEIVQELAERMLAKVVKRTPVGVKPTFDEADTVKIKGAKRRIQYKTKRGEKLFRNQQGRTYRFLTKSGEIREKYWSGYVGGNLRRSWQIGNVVRNGNSYEIEVFNDAEYASYVEYGHRQQSGRYVPALGKKLKAGWVKGRFMMTISEMELRAQAPAIVEKRLREYFEEVLS